MVVERSYSRTYVTHYEIPRSASTYVVAAPVTLARSSTTVFTSNPRSYHPSTYYTPPVTRIGVVGSSPHYSDRYPYVRYSGYSPGPYASHSISTYTTYTSPHRQRYSQRDASPSRYADSSYHVYQPSYGSSSYSYSTRSRPVSLNVDDAVNMYKRRYLTSGTLSKYWLTPRYWENRRESEKRVSSAMANLGYSNANIHRYLA